MPSSSAKTHQLGRQVWTTVRDSLDSWVWRVPVRTAHRPLTGVGLCRSFAAEALGREACRPSLFHNGTRRLFGLPPPPAPSRLSPNHVRRSCTSGGLLLLCLSSPTPASSTVVATCTAAADTAIAGTVPKAALDLGRQTWRRWQSTARDKKTAQGEHESTKPGTNTTKPTTSTTPTTPSTSPNPSTDESIATSMSKYLQSHLPTLPKIPPRPTKEEFLAAATGFWQRLQARFKWHSIRSMRPWNADEWGAFVSWVMLGHLLWILVGTTTFFSLAIFIINTVFAQETLAKWVGDYLTQSAGVTVVFESAIVPRWNDGVITFRNVFVSRRPGQIKSSVTKGSSSEAAIAAAQHSHDADDDEAANAAAEPATPTEEHDDGNYTQYDVTINSVDVTLSFVKWWNGKGLLRDVEVKGVRGVVDRTHVRWSRGPLDPLSFRHEHRPGDFAIERFKLEDLMVTVLQPNDFRPFNISIFSCELPQFRKQWLFYDFLSASHVSGSYDGSLFTIHPRQVPQIRGLAAAAGGGGGAAAVADVVDDSHHNINNPEHDPMALESPLAWKKFSRLRIDGLKIDHLNRGDRGPFGWIYEGNVDIVADLMLPAEAGDGLAQAVMDFYDKMEEAVTSNRYIRILDGNYSSRRAQQVEIDNSFAEEADAPPAHSALSASAPPIPIYPVYPPSTGPPAVLPQYVIMDLRMHLNDVRAAVPFFPASDALGQTRTQSYVNAALIRPIVAYMNAKRTYIPINCRIVKHLSDFDGSWTSYDCGLMDDSSAEVYAAFAHDVEDQQSRVRRLKKVGLYTTLLLVSGARGGL